MFHDPDDRYGLGTYRKVLLTGALAILMVVGTRLLQDIRDGVDVYVGAAFVLFVLGFFTEPLYHLVAGRRRDR